MPVMPDAFIIFGANSIIGSTLARGILPLVKNLILFYHKQTDKIDDLLGDDKVMSYSQDIRDLDAFLQNISDLKSRIDISDLAAVYMSTQRSSDFQPLSTTDMSLTRDIVEINFLGAIHFLKGIFTINKSVSSTRIVLMGSNVSRKGLKNGSVYAATKAALSNLTRSVSQEEGASNTLINTVSPGPVESDQSGFSKEYATFRIAYFQEQKKMTSLDRLSSPVDVCEMILFLTSLQNKNITGEEFFVTGGSL
jgi:NAD(P)-dependent dehydrogenase (short-subunit alcohol dehydrogenase family)